MVMSAGTQAHEPTRPRRGPRRERLRIALLAPPWIPVPPPGYGGIERVIADLAGGLVRRGHDVSLLAAPGSESAAEVVTLLERDYAEKIGGTMVDVDHVARAGRHRGGGPPWPSVPGHP